MKNEAVYFSHDSNARNDLKIVAMIGQFGLEGYGRFWVLIENLRDAADHKLPCKKYVWDALAMQMKCKSDDAEKFVLTCVNDFELLASDASHFWSESLNKRMGRANDVKEKRRAAAEKRWFPEKPVASNANAMQNDAIERKGKEKKENNIKSVDAAFDAFWDAYGNKVNRIPAVKAWSKLSEADRGAATAAAPGWLQRTGQTIAPHPATFLNNRRWEDSPNPVTANGIPINPATHTPTGRPRRHN